MRANWMKLAIERGDQLDELRNKLSTTEDRLQLLVAYTREVLKHERSGAVMTWLHEGNSDYTEAHRLLEQLPDDIKIRLDVTKPGK